ncbi:27 kDa glycoprotein-like [Diprion similis]|uniref:27 kDa glycoprotein-like n=1 Tax=Diprion similis TaxID=362088 RepID=UPI001EF9764A|nr:27 kDa glycoprotein-like [Diprion similis]
MKILIILGFLVIAGIKNSNIVQAKESEPETGVKERYINFLRKINVYPLSGEDSDEIDEQQIQEKCNNNGGPTAYNTSLQGLESFQNSVQSIINSINTTGDGRTEKDFADVCRSIQNLNNLVTLAVNAVKPCWNLNERQAVEVIVNVSFSLAEYVCKTNGSPLLEFYTADGVKCLNEISDSMDNNCFPDNSTFTNSITYSGNTAIPRQFSPPTTTIDRQYCTDMETAQNCVIREMNACKQKTPSNFINTIWNIYKKGSGCEAILKKNAANAVNSA